MGAFLILLFVVFSVLCVVVSLMKDCIYKIPGAEKDENFYRIFKYFDLEWYFPVDKTPPKHYNRNVKPNNPYRDAWYNDPIYRSDWTKK